MRLKKNIAISETGFLFDPSTGDSYNLNPVGLEILQMIKASMSRGEIIQFIIEKYDVEQSALEHYFYDFISMLKHFQIIEDHARN